MKKITGLIIILAVLILGGYYTMGVLTEKTIRKNIEVIDQSNGLYAEIEEYHKGLFSSEAKIKWRLHVPERIVKDDKGQMQTLPAQDYKMEMPLTVNHGPIIFAKNRVHFGLGYAQAVLPFPAQYMDQFNSQFTSSSIKPQLDLSIFVNYLNESTVDFKVPSFNLIAKEGNGRFEWLGMNAMTTMSSGMKKIAGQVVFDGFNALKDDSKVTVTNVSSDYDLHETPAGLYLGDANFKLSSFNVFVKEQKMFDINELVVNSDSDIEQHLFNTHFTVTGKSVLANGQNYGPGELEVALRNIDADVLAQINQQAATMQNGNDTQRQQAMLSMLPELPKLLSKGAEFEISKLSLTIPQGLIEGNLYITLPKGENTNPFESMQKIQGKSKLKVPVAAVKQILQQSVLQQIAKQPELQQSLEQQLKVDQTASPAAVAVDQENQPALTAEQVSVLQADKQINAMLQSGLIIAQGSDYMLEVSLEQGRFTVNGKPFDSSMVKF